MSTECTICLYDFRDPEGWPDLGDTDPGEPILATLPCGHVYHTHCIRLARNRGDRTVKCPLCRKTHATIIPLYLDQAFLQQENVGAGGSSDSELTGSSDDEAVCDRRTDDADDMGPGDATRLAQDPSPRVINLAGDMSDEVTCVADSFGEESDGGQNANVPASSARPRATKDTSMATKKTASAPSSWRRRDRKRLRDHCNRLVQECTALTHRAQHAEASLRDQKDATKTERQKTRRIESTLQHVKGQVTSLRHEVNVAGQELERRSRECHDMKEELKRLHLVASLPENRRILKHAMANEHAIKSKLKGKPLSTLVDQIVALTGQVSLRQHDRQLFAEEQRKLNRDNDALKEEIERLKDDNEYLREENKSLRTAPIQRYRQQRQTIEEERSNPVNKTASGASVTQPHGRFKPMQRGLYEDLAGVDLMADTAGCPSRPRKQQSSTPQRTAPAPALDTPPTPEPPTRRGATGRHVVIDLVDEADDTDATSVHLPEQENEAPVVRRPDKGKGKAPPPRQPEDVFMMPGGVGLGGKRRSFIQGVHPDQLAKLTKNKIGVYKADGKGGFKKVRKTTSRM